MIKPKMFQKSINSAVECKAGLSSSPFEGGKTLNVECGKQRRLTLLDAALHLTSGLLLIFPKIDLLYF